MLVEAAGSDVHAAELLASDKAAAEGKASKARLLLAGTSLLPRSAVRAAVIAVPAVSVAAFAAWWLRGITGVGSFACTKP